MWYWFMLGIYSRKNGGEEIAYRRINSWTTTSVHAMRSEYFCLTPLTVMAVVSETRMLA